MTFFHDEEDAPREPLPGLPETLPKGEWVLWQGRPSALALAINAFRLRWVAAYFAIMTIFRVSKFSADSAAPELLTQAILSSFMFFMLAVTLIGVLAFAMSRAALFTITSQRVVLRYGVAVRKYVNAPFETMESAKVKLKSARVGDITLQFSSDTQPPYLHLWPFVRPFKFSRPEPMLRGIPDPKGVAQILARAAYDRAPANIQMELGEARLQESDKKGYGAVNSASAT